MSQIRARLSALSHELPSTNAALKIQLNEIRPLIS